jgi:diacylglycerol kinase (ATP)
MSTEPNPGFPSRLTFKEDTASRRKKGVHRPVYADVFTQSGAFQPRPSKVYMLVNPYSGKRKGQQIAQQAQTRLEEAGVEVQVLISAYSGHLVSLASTLMVEEGEVIAAIGGDGTLCEVLSGRMLLNHNRRECFAILPAGTGNSQANDLGLYSPDDTVNAILGGQIQALDLAKVELTEGLPGNERERIVRYSHNLVTWGLGVDSNIQAEKMRWMGPIRYDVGIVLAILANRKRRATLTINTTTITDEFTLFLVQNSQTGGSLLPLAPGASLDDGEMDIGILKRMKRGAVLNAFGMLKSEGRHVFHPKVDYHRFTTLRIETETPTAINVDGENLGSTPLSMEVIKHAVNIVVPAQNEKSEKSSSSS